jgi:AbrB family looped-hinge helix DNA binding protein
MPRTLIRMDDDIAVTIPADVLERYGLKAGDTVELVTTQDGITIKPVTVTFNDVLEEIALERAELFQALADYDQRKVANPE